jgi:hypothetical protein
LPCRNVLSERFVEVFSEPVEARLPEASIVEDPAGRITQRHGYEPAQPNAPLLPNGSEPRALQHADVLRDRRERHVEVARELADRLVPARQLREDRATRAIRQRPERCIELILTINHMVYYSIRNCGRQEAHLTKGARQNDAEH